MAVSLREVKKQLADRPKKFNERDVDYRRANGSNHRCLTCEHFFRSKSRNVCELFRPTGDTETKTVSVRGDWVCDFWTGDGIRYPDAKEE